MAVLAIAKGPTAMPAASASSCPASRRSGWSRAIRCCISCSGCATRRTASRSARTGQARRKAIAQSALDEVPGIGAGRKKALLHHFGSARAVEWPVCSIWSQGGAGHLRRACPEDL